jgi:hypothetical protein
MCVVARAIFPHELQDPDFAWLIDSFRESNPDVFLVEGPCIPVTFVRSGSPETLARLRAEAAVLAAGTVVPSEGFEESLETEDK